jgi:hypothetical protein
MAERRLTEVLAVVLSFEAAPHLFAWPGAQALACSAPVPCTESPCIASS